MITIRQELVTDFATIRELHAMSFVKEKSACHSILTSKHLWNKQAS